MNKIRATRYLRILSDETLLKRLKKSGVCTEYYLEENIEAMTQLLAIYRKVKTVDDVEDYNCPFCETRFSCGECPWNVMMNHTCLSMLTIVERGLVNRRVAQIRQWRRVFKKVLAEITYCEDDF